MAAGPGDAVENTPHRGAAGTIVLGEGTWPLYIFADWDIEVNTR